MIPGLDEAGVVEPVQDGLARPCTVAHSTSRSGSGLRPGYQNHRSLHGSSGSIRSHDSSTLSTATFDESDTGVFLGRAGRWRLPGEDGECARPSDQ